MELRGFDDYEVTLGDEIRGERASMGKTIEDVERELHIKGSLILGIENADLGAFPNPSVVSGYVRSYARYLRKDPEEMYRRFCRESGFVPPSVAFGASAAGEGGGARASFGAGANPFDQSRFATPPAQSRFAARISLGWLASACALLALVAGIGYGGYALLQNVQRVGFAPLPEAPEVVAEPPRVLAAGAPAGRPDAGAYGTDGVLAAVFAPDDEPPIQRRDGPISAIDPEEAGVFDQPARSVAPRVEGPETETAWARSPGADAAPEAGRPLDAQAPVVAAATAAPEPEPEPVERGIAIHVIDRAWVRVRDETRAVIFEGILEPGGRYDVPERVRRAELHAGNAGAVYFVVDGETFGPAGRPGGVVRRVGMTREEIAEAYEVAPTALAAYRTGEEEGSRQAAALPQD